VMRQPLVFISIIHVPCLNDFFSGILGEEDAISPHVHFKKTRGKYGNS